MVGRRIRNTHSDDGRCPGGLLGGADVVLDADVVDGPHLLVGQLSTQGLVRNPVRRSPSTSVSRSWGAGAWAFVAQDQPDPAQHRFHVEVVQYASLAGGRR